MAWLMGSRWFGRVACCAAGAALLCGGGGCYAWRDGTADRAARVPELPALTAADWPRREPAAAHALHEATEEVFDVIARTQQTSAHSQPPLPPGADEAAHTDADAREDGNNRPKVHWRLAQNRLGPAGLLRIVEATLADEGANRGQERFGLMEFLVGFEPNGTFISSYTLDRHRFRAEAAARAARREASPKQDVWALDRRALAAEYPRLAMSDLCLDEGAEIGFPLRVAPDTRGVIIHLPALYGQEYERRAVAAFEDRGWTILHVRGPTWAIPPNDAAIYEAEEARGVLILELVGERMRADAAAAGTGPDGKRLPIPPFPDDEKLTAIRKRAEAEIPLPPTGFEALPGETPEEVAGRIARAVDDALAEGAYAAEAALDALLEEHPALRERPVVVIGFSAGALAAPTVAARLAERIDALVLIGGGADTLSVALESSVSDGGLCLWRPGEDPLDAQNVAAVIEAYREQSRLDPYNTAPLLAEIPTLQVMARGDEMVPTEAQRALWERLGRPERLLYRGPMGHAGMFYFLPRQTGRIDRWLNRVTGWATAPRRP